MTAWLSWIVVVAVGTLVAVYFLHPHSLVALAIGVARKWGRLSAKSIVVDGITWPYLEGGPADGPIVVMIHGFGGDKKNWSLYARHFTKRFRVIAPDLPGFGENIRDRNLRYGAPEQAERLDAFLTGLGLDNIHLTGSSMGGLIVLTYALSYPDRLRSLTLIDTAGVTSLKKSELDLAIDAGENPLVVTSMDDFDRLTDFVMHKRIPSPKFMMQAMLEVQLEHFELLDQIFWTIAEEALGESLTERLGELVMPTLIIWGRHDRLVDVSCTEVMAAAIPDNRVVIVEDAGHVPMVERPRETASQQVNWLDDLESHANR